MIRPLITRDPTTGGELVVTRLEAVDGSVAIEGRFSLGWVGKLTPQQLDFLGLLLARRNNLQQLATDLGVAYNTAKARFDDIVAAVGGTTAPDVTPAMSPDERTAILDALEAGDIDAAEATRLLRR